jgi:hypothetical protein
MKDSKDLTTKISEDPILDKSKTPMSINLENSLLEALLLYQRDSLEPERVSAIKTLLRFALHEKGYLKNF